MGSRDLKRKPLCLVWAYAIQRNKSKRDALCRLTWLKREKNRYALCGQQKKRIVRRWMGPREWKREIVIPCVGNKRYVIVIHCVGSRDWKRTIVMPCVGNKENNRDALCGLMWLKKRIVTPAMSNKRMVIVMRCAGSWDSNRNIAMRCVGSRD